jgi:hypothetical protein
MNNLRVRGCIFFLLFVILFAIGVWNVTGTYATSVTTSQSPVNTIAYPITINQSVHGNIVPGTTTVNFGPNQIFTITPDDGYRIASINVNDSEVAIAKPSGQSYQFNRVLANSSLIAAFAIDTLPIVLVLVVVLIIIAIIFIYRLPENRYKNIAVLDTYEMRKIASVRITIEKIRSLEEEKKSFLLEIEKLDRMSESKATALESEVNALENKAKSLKTLTSPEPSAELKRENCKNKTVQD